MRRASCSTRSRARASPSAAASRSSGCGGCASGSRSCWPGERRGNHPGHRSAGRGRPAAEHRRARSGGRPHQARAGRHRGRTSVSRTSNRRVYAIGDVTGLPAFTHSATHQAALLIRHLLFRLPIRLNVDEIPRVTFTDPELAHVGLTDAQARERHGAIRVLRWPYRDNDRAQAERETRGHIKVVTDPKGLILGATIVGAAAGEQITAWTLAINQGLNIRAFAEIVDALSDLYGDRKTGGHHLLHATFDDHLGAAHFEPVALVWLRPRHSMTQENAPLEGQATGLAEAQVRGLARPAAPWPVRQAPGPDDPVRDDRGSADLCAVDRELPAELAERPPRRRPHRGAGAGRRAERHGAGKPGAANPRQRRRPRGGDEDGHASAGCWPSPTCRRDPSRHRHAQRVLVPRDHRCVRHAAVATTRTSCGWSGRRRWAATSSRS